MNKLNPILFALSLAATCVSVAPAQDQSAAGASAPKYLQVNVEYTKPGKGGMAHDKTESAFVQAMTKAKFPIHYTAFNALTGRPRAIYLSSFDSFEEMEKANKAMASPATAAEFERLNVADGELLEESHSLIFESVPELSYHFKTPGAHNRYLEAEIIQVRPGHGKDFEDLAKIVMAAKDKAGSSDHWGAYRILYGEPSGTYVLLTASNSAADIDQGFAEHPKYIAALSDDDKNKLRELQAAAIESVRSELYTVNPAQSYASEDTIKADPEFWKPKAAAASSAKPVTAEKKTTP